jgi:hypothetical protein
LGYFYNGIVYFEEVGLLSRLPEARIREMRWTRIPIFGIVAWLIGWGVGNVLIFGYFQHWQKLPNPPSAISELISICDGTLFVKTVDGTPLQCSLLRSECWVDGSFPKDCEGYTTLIKACELSSPEFWLIANPPNGVRACLQGTVQYPEAANTATFLVDGDGHIWQRDTMLFGWVPQLTSYLPFCCPVIGVVLALISLLIPRRASIATS